MLQRDLPEDLRQRTLATHHEIARLVRPLDAERLHRRPSDGGWSVGQVLEHLCISVEIYEPGFQTMLRTSRVDAAAALREWKPSIFGRMLVYSLIAPRKLAAPRGMTPAVTPRGGVLEAFLAHHSALATRIGDTGRFDWRAARMASPVVPRILQPLARLNLGDVLSVFVVHAERHTRQIERVIGTLS
jgi:hypothetical protein